MNFRMMPRLINVTEISNMLLGVGAANLTLLDSGDEPYNLVVPLMVYRTRLYDDNDVLLRCNDHPSIHCLRFVDNVVNDKIHMVSNEPTTRLLWHAH
jgi:hypothetical protein